MDPILNSELLRTSQAIAKFASGTIDFSIFTQQYGNFYYVAALDGHEEDVWSSKINQSFPSLVRLHAEVQHTIDQTMPVITAAFRRVGRIEPTECRARIREAVARANLNDELMRLRGFSAQ